jgi:hypothetical protein
MAGYGPDSFGGSDYPDDPRHETRAGRGRYDEREWTPNETAAKASGPTVRQLVKEGSVALDELSAAVEAAEMILGPLLRASEATKEAVGPGERYDDPSSEIVRDLKGQVNRTRALARRIIEVCNRLEV